LATNLPDGVTVNQASGTVYVSCGGDNTVWLVSGKTNQALYVVMVGRFPQSLAYDVADGGVYVADYTDDNVGIIFGP